MKKLLNKIRYRSIQPEPLIKLEISRKAMVNNLHSFKKYVQLAIAPVLKSNAYGHGLIQAAEILKKESVPFLVIDSFYEAVTLRRALINTPVLIIGYSTLEQINIHLDDVAYTITSLDMLRDLSKDLKWRRRFHLKIDTGMRRQGILPSEIDAAVKLIKANNNIELEGVCSHFADADNADDSFSIQQINIWNKSVAILKNNFPTIKYFHLSASGGSVFTKKIDANVLRLGIGLYGISPSPKLQLDLVPALKMTAKVVGVKEIKRNEGIGYNLTHKAKADSKIAIIPVGYYEGVDRRLSNTGSVIINRTNCPIVGRICMNICMADVTNANAKIGDVVTIISNKPEDKNLIQKMAILCRTNPHELLVHIPSHLRREIV